MGRLDGKVAIVTGGARGQGAAEARLFAGEGAQVVVTDVLDAEGEATAKEAGGLFVHHDVADEAAWEAVVARAKEAYGRIDVLVNNAGIFHRSRMIDYKLDEFRRVIDINLIGVFLGMKTVAPTMIAQESGSIINISSIAGLVAAPGGVAYGASKFAVRGMTKSAAIELARYNVRVNSIHPGMIDTPMMTEVTGGDQTRFDRIERSVPLRRAAQPEDVAKLALFLASEESAYSTGSEFVIDGGVTAL
ncbi:MAG: glucose 1-dehydrogenase [Acidimicrobiales bacterium]